MQDNLPNRKNPRLAGYDYSQASAYFITACCADRRPFFGRIHDAKLEASPLGRMLSIHWNALADHYSNLVLDSFVVMPNHFHGLLFILDPVFLRRHYENREKKTGEASLAPAEIELRSCHSLGSVIGSLKSGVTREWRAASGKQNAEIWQRGYHERIVRNDQALARFREYNLYNPLRWELDRENPDRTGTDVFDVWLDSDSA